MSSTISLKCALHDLRVGGERLPKRRAGSRVMEVEVAMEVAMEVDVCLRFRSSVVLVVANVFFSSNIFPVFAFVCTVHDGCAVNSLGTNLVPN